MAHRVKRDRYERRHRRTWSHPESVAFMASADFGRVPPLHEILSGVPMIPEQPKIFRDVCSLANGEIVIEWPAVLDGDGAIIEGWMALMLRKMLAASRRVPQRPTPAPTAAVSCKPVPVAQPTADLSQNGSSR